MPFPVMELVRRNKLPSPMRLRWTEDQEAGAIYELNNDPVQFAQLIIPYINYLICPVKIIILGPETRSHSPYLYTSIV